MGTVLLSMPPDRKGAQRCHGIGVPGTGVPDKRLSIIMRRMQRRFPEPCRMTDMVSAPSST